MTTAIVLAGGLGTRLRSAVPDLPKPMAPVAGRPFLAHLMDHWLGQGVQRFILSVGYRHEAIRSFFGDAYRGVAIDYAVETTPQGTGGGLRLAAARLPAGEPALVLNGDTFFAVSLPELRAFAEQHDADWCLSLFPATEAGRYMGLKLDAEGRIEALRHEDQRPGRPANGGVYWVQARVWQTLSTQNGPLSLEDDCLPSALAAGQRLFGMADTAPFIDIGVPHDYHRAAQVLPTRAARETSGVPA
jgi:D-glycero-alpha-D-manno-heptose 1-phosphate guanylyltransferase